MNPLVSVIIPTYNRFDIVKKTIESVKHQTYKNIEIIVVNDCSTEKEYYSHKWDIKIIHLPENSRKKFTYPCAGYVRDQGVKQSKGEYIAFLDDDDYWLPHKVEKQVKALREYDICCTEALCGRGTYEERIEKRMMLQDYHFKYIWEKYMKNGVDISNGFPEKWGEQFIRIHNCIITSSVMIKKKIIDKYGMMPYLKNGKEDYNYWKHLLKYMKCYFISEPCLYYDLGHGKGREY